MLACSFSDEYTNSYQDLWEIVINPTIVISGTPSDGAENDEEKTVAETLHSNQQLVVEQVKITDHEGSLKVIYPSRTDLLSDSFKVVRKWEGWKS